MVKKAISKGTALAITATMLAAAIIPSGAFASSSSESVSISIQAKDMSSSAMANEGTAANEGNANESVTAKISKTKAEELLRQYISIPKEYNLQGTQFHTENLADGKRNVWGMDFIKRVNGKHLGSIYAAINADNGQLVNFSSYSNEPNVKPSYPLKVEREQAQEIGLSFIKEVAGDYAAAIEINEHYGTQLLPALTGEVRHQFRFDRIVNDIPFLDNYINVTVDSEGHIVEYSFVWDDTVNFPKMGTYLTLEQASSKLRAAGEPALKYIIPYGGQGKRIPMLSYNLPTFSIDAVTGEKSVEPSYQHYRFSGEVSDTPLTAKPLAAAPPSSSINEEQAIAKVKAAFTIPEGSVLQNSSYNEYTDDGTGELSASWNLSWTIMKDKKEVGSLWAAVNGRTGAVQSYNIYWNSTDTADKESTNTLDKSISTAIDVVKQQLPWLTHELYVIKPDSKQYENIISEQMPDHYIRFAHKVHGADVDYDSVNVTVDARTGVVKGFDAYIQAYEYPNSAPTVITKEAAVEHWMDYYRTELTYRLVNSYEWKGEPIPIEKYNLMLASGELATSDDVERTTTVELVYRLVAKAMDQRVFLDAISGEWRNQETGEITQLERPKALDAEGHWAQHQLELMVAYKALDVVDGKVRPNEPIKRGELIKMLVLARSGGNLYGYSAAETASKNASFADVAAGSEYFAYVENALAQNLIDLGDGSFNPEGTVSREEMAELIVRALGYNSLANVDHIFVDNFKDSAQMKSKGQAAIVVGLNIMSLTDGKFLPQKQVQRAEAATAFFRYLQSRAELQEAPLRM